MNYTAKPEAWITEHDLSLMFDAGGRLWKFRPAVSAHATQPVEVHRDDDAIELEVTIDGLRPGDLDLRLRGDVLEIRGQSDRTKGLVYDVGLPVTPALDQLETAFHGEVLRIRVPLASVAHETVDEFVPVAT